LLCDEDWALDSGIDSDSLFGTNSGNTLTLDTYVGIGLDGVMLKTAVTPNDVDPYYPVVYGDVTDADSEEETVDICLGHVDDEGLYVYHTMSPCIGSSTLSNFPKTCDDVSACKKDHLTYALGKFSNTENKPIGIAKDGAIIWGPYDSNGDEWTDCDVDVCNGL
jgi:hypothetical protein